MEEIGSKEERRKRKKKIEVAELFRYYKKRPSTDNPKDGISPTPSTSAIKEEDEEEDEEEEARTESMAGSGGEEEQRQPAPSPQQPPLPAAAGSNEPDAPATAESEAGSSKKKKKKKKKKSSSATPAMNRVEQQKTLFKDQGDVIKLKDDKLPPGWEKRARLKTVGTKAGKWDVIIIGPEGRTFRSKQDIKHYLFVRQLEHDLDLFDFRLGTDFYTSRGQPIPKRALNPLVRPSPSAVKKEETAGPSAAGPSSRSRKRTAEVKKEDVAESQPTDSVPPVDALLPAAPALPEPPPVSPSPLRSKRLESPSVGPSNVAAGSEPMAPAEPQTIVPEEASGGYRCPLEDCRKLFRRDNLLVVSFHRIHPINEPSD